MANLNKTRGKAAREKPALQLTSYQLVMAICALLLLMCALFIAGIFVQRFSSGDLAPQQTASNDQSARTDAASSPVVSAQPRTEGVQVAPRPVVLPSNIDKPTTTQSRPGTERETGAKYIPAPPPRRDSAKTTEPAPVASPATPKAAAPAPTAKPNTTPTTVPDPVAAPTQPATPVIPEQPAQSPATQAAKTEEAPAPVQSQAKPPVEASKGAYTIQVASFDAGNLERAKKFKTETEEKTSFKVNLVPSTDGKRVRAFVGEYADRAAADKARDTMRKTKGFEDCFVKSLSEE
jgi:hypothetical protein